MLPRLQTTTELVFIPDAGLREGLRLDISTANQALANGEWKAATVLAGSVVEALLLWAVDQQSPAAITQAITGAQANGTLQRPPPPDRQRWDLEHFIPVAAALTLITPETATATSLARGFRNLIHPGRAQRLGQVCDRATALQALAAVYMVIRCLTPP